MSVGGKLGDAHTTSTAYRSRIWTVYSRRAEQFTI